MSGGNSINRNLWIITGLASVPFAVLAFIEPAKVSFPHIYYLFGLAIFFNGLVVPFVLFNDEPGWFRKTLALGVNLLFAFLWIEYTGRAESIFYPNFFLLPIFAAALYCGFPDAIVTAFFGSALTLYFRYTEVGLSPWIFNDRPVMVNLVFFFLIAIMLGYLIRVLREQQAATMKITDELETAYHQMAVSHEQLQSYIDIIEKMNKEMEQLAITDELTMLYNYRYFQMALDKELKRNKEGVLSLMMLDIDHFKQFNDVYGHITGNKLLAEIARIIRENVRDVDIVARYGGEEFAVIFPGLLPQDVLEIAERIRVTVENTPVRTACGKLVAVNISEGIAGYPHDARNKSELISHADLALFEAKQSGRNQVRIYKVS